MNLTPERSDPEKSHFEKIQYSYSPFGRYSSLKSLFLNFLSSAYMYPEEFNLFTLL